MYLRTATLIAGLTTACIAFTGTANAQTAYFGVEASAETLGYSGCYRDSPGFLSGQTFLDAASDPAGVVLTQANVGSAFADVGAASEAASDHLHVSASSLTYLVSGRSYDGYKPYGFGYAHSWDKLTVMSDTLPKGAPVTLVFDNSVDLAQWSCTGLCSGYVQLNIQIAASAANSRWDFWYGAAPTMTHQPQITVKTTVGSRFSVDSKLRAYSSTFYFISGYGFGGNMESNATATLSLNPASTAEVWLQGDSGVEYRLPAE
jgi:hypothetical protein